MSRGSAITTEVDIWVSDVLDELSDQELMEEMANRKLGPIGGSLPDTLREWRDALERGDNPMRVAASIRAFISANCRRSRYRCPSGGWTHDPRPMVGAGAYRAAARADLDGVWRGAW